MGRELTWHDALFGYTIGQDDATFDTRDSSAFAPLAAVADPAFTWGNDRRPARPWHETLIYELHVKGFTQRMPDVPDRIRGTYAGIGSAAALDHLKKLNVTAVELLPAHYRVGDRQLMEKGLSNYWGYNTLGFFAPDPRFSTNPRDPNAAVREFKSMVRSLHAAGIEVILDVVYNHTAEGNQMGPTLSLRGLDNASYYFLSPESQRHYMDFTGCGNSPNMRHPRVLQLVMDSLRYWVEDMHVDGFRFDLAPTLARELAEVDKLGSFFDIIHQDPVLSRVKLIAEPWDIGPGGYMVGNFPVGWTEWNGEYRDAVRGFWSGKDVPTSLLAHRLTGSGDLYERTGRRPYASINFVTCHDGFTLRDLVSYEQKHNLANGEENRDGHNDNRNWNCGVEGPSDDPKVNARRAPAAEHIRDAAAFAGRADDSGRRRTRPDAPRGRSPPTSTATTRNSTRARSRRSTARASRCRSRRPRRRRSSWNRPRPTTRNGRTTRRGRPPSSSASTTHSRWTRSGRAP